MAASWLVGWSAEEGVIEFVLGLCRHIKQALFPNLEFSGTLNGETESKSSTLSPYRQKRLTVVTQHKEDILNYIWIQK